MKNKPKLIALIPARSGSKRVPEKNIKQLNGHPLLAYSIQAAIQSEVFSKVVVSTDSHQYAEVAKYYGAEVPFLRPEELAGDLSMDIEWVSHVLTELKELGELFDCFSILRPTSPFRMPKTIAYAWKLFLAEEGIDSLRAVEKCAQHPGKMWVVNGKRMIPLLPLSPPDRPWHSSQYQSLPEVYVQNASLEIAWTRVVFEQKTIAGTVLVPFFTKDYEGFDINSKYDWHYATNLLKNKQVSLPEITQESYKVKGVLRNELHPFDPSK